MAATHRADRIITGTAATKKLLIELCDVPDSKITVIPYRLPDLLLQASSDAAILGELGLDPFSYFLYVGQLKVHKNVPTLLSAFQQYCRKHPSTRLVLVAYAAAGRMELEASIAEKSLERRVVIVGRMGFPRLKALYEHAIALLIPSLAEGFGLPAMESMALGTPVIASRVPALVEATGDAALLIDPRVPEELCEAMSTIANSHTVRRDLIARGFRRASCFATFPIGAATRKVYESVL